MKTKLLPICLLLASAVVVSGCAALAGDSVDNQTATDNQTTTDNETMELEPVTPPPMLRPIREGWAKPRDLTQQEKDQVVQIALTVREMEQWLQKPYRTEMVWFVKTGAGWIVTSTPSPDSPDALGFYPGVSITFSSPPKVVFDIAVDLTAGITVRFRQSTVEEHFLPKPLTDEEKAEASRIATIAIKTAGEGQPNDYNRVTFCWMAQTSNGVLTKLDYAIVENGLPDNAPLYADYYPGVVYQMGSTDFTTVVVDLQNGNTVDIVLSVTPIPGMDPFRDPFRSWGGPARNPNLP